MVNEYTHLEIAGRASIHNCGYSSTHAIMIRIDGRSYSIKTVHMEIDEARGNDLVFGAKYLSCTCPSARYTFTTDTESPNELKRKLDLARRCRQVIEGARATYRVPL